MKSFLCVDFLICSIVLLVALAGISEAELEQSKNRRGGGGTSGLIAFPRIGRSDPSMINNNLHDDDALTAFDSLYAPSASALDDYDEYPKSEAKRASLIAFPRVGRNDATIRKWARFLALQQALDKRTTGPSATTGLWFGPRLGKRSIAASVEEQQQLQAENALKGHV